MPIDLAIIYSHWTHKTVTTRRSKKSSWQFICLSISSVPFNLVYSEKNAHILLFALRRTTNRMRSGIFHNNFYHSSGLDSFKCDSGNTTLRTWISPRSGSTILRREKWCKKYKFILSSIFSSSARFFVLQSKSST